jgi:hypothetical protein
LFEPAMEEFALNYDQRMVNKFFKVAVIQNLFFIFLQLQNVLAYFDATSVRKKVSISI